MLSLTLQQLLSSCLRVHHQLSLSIRLHHLSVRLSWRRILRARSSVSLILPRKRWWLSCGNLPFPRER
jgi:hypothetical protein